MPLARSWCVTLSGIDGRIVEVEADLANGVPGTSIVGLPDTALSEARDRVKAATVNTGEPWPQKKITVNLSPATLRKAGSHFDLALACAVLAADGRVPADRLHGLVLIGEVGLDGRVRPVRGVLPAVLAAAKAGYERVVVPLPNLAEAELVPGVSAFGVGSLRSLLGWLRGEALDETAEPAAEVEPDDSPCLDLADVAGQRDGRFALEVAAAGGHHLYLLGPPGAGKTMLAERLPGILPELEPAAAIEVTAIHSVAGALPGGAPLVTRAPYRAPHHSATSAALLGGGSGAIRPGEISLAHRGVLFLDEAPEFAAGMLDALRQPLESGHITIARSVGVVRYPAKLLLVLAANPCPCGGSESIGAACECTAAQRRRYLARLSGPLLDRVDIRLTLHAVARAELLEDMGRAEPSAVVAGRVAEARARMARRLADTPWLTNSEVPGRELRRTFRVPRDGRAVLDQALRRGRLSARGVDRVLRVAWTLADLREHDVPTTDDVADAQHLRLNTLRKGTRDDPRGRADDSCGAGEPAARAG